MLKTLWPKYLLFKNRIEPVNIEHIEFSKNENITSEFITPPVLEKIGNFKYVCKDGNVRLTNAVKENYTHAMCYVVEDKCEISFLKRLNDLVYENEKNNIPMNDFEFIFKDDFLYALIDKCKKLF